MDVNFEKGLTTIKKDGILYADQPSVSKKGGHPAMGRNKCPEQTKEKIIHASIKLFLEKGYEQTSVQDILDEIPLSKGGLYHHFKSKEEILEAVMQKRVQYVCDAFHEIIQNTHAENAREKLRKILFQLLTDSQTLQYDSILANEAKNPHFIVNGLESCIKQDAPIIRRLIEDGVQDGSLQTSQPECCAEVFLLLINFWINPILFHWDMLEAKKRLAYLGSLMRFSGLDILDDGFMESLMDGYEKMGAFPNNPS